MPPVNEKLAELTANVESLSKQINRVYDALYGNGKPGLISEFRELRQNVQSHHESVRELQTQSRNDWKWVITTIVAIAAIAVAYFK